MSLPEDSAEGRYALLFPGAGSHLPGMARRLTREFASARAVLDWAGEVTGLDLPRLCTEGRPAELADAEVSHPAVVATALACSAAVREHTGSRWTGPSVVGGHSLGHFAALVEVGALPFEVALVTVARRARLMTEQTRHRHGRMVSIVGTGPEQLERWCTEETGDGPGVVVVACYNGPQHSVISGDADAVGRVAARADGVDGLRVTEVSAGVASHSPLMVPVQEAMADELTRAPLVEPEVPVLLNSTGRLGRDVSELRADLLCQLERPVRWNDAMHSIAAAGVRTVLDTGPGTVLAKSARLHPELEPVALNFMEPLARVLPVAVTT